jgi:transcriptional regulator with XRE-family HTH domain
LVNLTLAGRCCILTEVEPIYLELGCRLREARRAARITQEALASRVDMSRTSITNIEKGRQRLTVDGLVRLAAAVGVEPAQLLPSTSGALAGIPPRKLRGLGREDRTAVERVLIQAWAQTEEV